MRHRASRVPGVTLNNGVVIPQVGLGLFDISDRAVPAAINAALRAGYRHFDSAAAYGNEESVGAALTESGLSRTELFITSKVRNADQGYESTLNAFDETLNGLQLEYIDLYLIHWPVPARDRYRETWRALERLYLEGRTRSIGVCNFDRHHLDRLMCNAKVPPAVNQIESHPFFQQPSLRAYHDEIGVVTQAWSPLARGDVRLLEHPLLLRIAEGHGVSSGQVVLRWHVQCGSVVFPKSVSPYRMRENIGIFGFALTPAEMADIESIDRNVRIGPDPDDVVGELSPRAADHE